jgi:hypothetical protein
MKIIILILILVIVLFVFKTNEGFQLESPTNVETGNVESETTEQAEAELIELIAREIGGAFGDRNWLDEVGNWVFHIFDTGRKPPEPNEYPSIPPIPNIQNDLNTLQNKRNDLNVLIKKLQDSYDKCLCRTDDLKQKLKARIDMETNTLQKLDQEYNDLEKQFNARRDLCQIYNDKMTTQSNNFAKFIFQPEDGTCKYWD